MRLRIYTATTMAEAMRQVRDELGPDAIIVSTRHEPDGRIRLSAAIEPGPKAPRAAETAVETEPAAATKLEAEAATLRRALAYHGIPIDTAARVLAAAARVAKDDATLVLGAALDEVFRFAPLAVSGAGRPLLLVGPPGSGKTSTVAKLLARARLAGVPATAIGADARKPGAAEGLAAVAAILETPFFAADGAGAILGLRSAEEWRGSVIIDGPGVNPFDDAELSALSELIAAADAEPVLVLPAGLDPIEAAEIGETFRSIGARRLVTTRLDLARRLGSMLAAVDDANAMFADVTFSAQIADPARPLTPLVLARLLLRDPLELDQPNFDGEIAA